LKDGEAERYAGIKITYIAGKSAILTIYTKGIKQEEIKLHEIDDKPRLHALFKEKGFVFKSDVATKADSDGVAGAANKNSGGKKTAAAGFEANKNQVVGDNPAAAAAGRSILSLPGVGKKEDKMVETNRSPENAKNKENSKSGTNIASTSAKRKNRRETERQARADERKYLGGSSMIPAIGEMLQLYVVLTLIILGVGSYSGLQRHRRNRRNQRVIVQPQQRQLQLRS
jgi:hypothetical protein